VVLSVRILRAVVIILDMPQQGPPSTPPPAPPPPEPPPAPPREQVYAVAAKTPCDLRTAAKVLLDGPNKLRSTMLRERVVHALRELGLDAPKSK
jgi:hypothetical protein